MDGRKKRRAANVNPLRDLVSSEGSPLKVWDREIETLWRQSRDQRMSRETAVKTTVSLFSSSPPSQIIFLPLLVKAGCEGVYLQTHTQPSSSSTPRRELNTE